MHSLELKIPPLAIQLIIGFALWQVCRLAPFADFTLPRQFTIALTLGVLGVALIFAGGIKFWLSKTTLSPMNPAAVSSLVISGAYRFTRNPMYLGLLLILLGWVVCLSNALALAGIPAFILCMNRFQIGPEERVLEARFGDDFTAYKARVRRWI